MKTKKKRTRLLSILLVLVMVVGLMPTVALAAEPATATVTADFSTDPITALALLNDVKTGTTDSTWDNTNKVLTLNGVNFETTNQIAVKLPDGAEIVLNGENIIKGGSGSGDCYGIHGEGSLTISGTGTLAVTSGTAGNLSSGIRAEKGVRITGGTVKATGGTADNQSFGIYTLKNNLTIEGGNVKAKGGDAPNSSNGLWAGNGSVDISGGEVEAESGRVTRIGASSGIYANNIRINNTGTIVTATGGTVQQGSSYGICAYRGVATFSGGTLTAATKDTTCILNYREVTGSGVKTISFDSNGGDGAMMAKTTEEEYTLPANGFTPPEGMQLKGWSIGDVYKAAGDKITVSADTNVKAVWENITYTVSFDANGGSGEMADVNISGNYTLPANGFTAPDGKQFKGWATSADGPVISGTTINVTGNTTLYAIWKDTQKPVINGLTGGKTYCDAVEFEVSDNVGVASVKVGNTNLTAGTNGKYTLNKGIGTVTVVAADKAGNSANVTVTVNSGHTDITPKDHVCDICGATISGHNLENIPAKNATVTETGNKEYWHCKDCDKNFSDKDGKNSIDLKDTVIAKLPLKIIEGTGQSIESGVKKELTFRSNAEFSDFIRVELDGKTLDAKYYTAKEGSTIVTLKADYAATLSEGDHTIGIVSTSGTATTKFTVNEKTAPKTGDANNIIVWLALIFMSGAGVIGTAGYGKKKRAK